MPTMIETISYNECLTVWEQKLWPGRRGIGTISAMLYAPEQLEYKIDLTNLQFAATFFGLFDDGKLIGVNSGHKCADGSYRSRGLWVEPEFRGNGNGVKLLAATVQQAVTEDCSFIWSYPRLTSKKTYEAAGFTITSDWRSSDTSDNNAYCIKHLKGQL